MQHFCSVIISSNHQYYLSSCHRVLCFIFKCEWKFHKGNAKQQQQQNIIKISNKAEKGRKKTELININMTTPETFKETFFHDFYTWSVRTFCLLSSFFHLVFLYSWFKIKTKAKENPAYYAEKKKWITEYTSCKVINKNFDFFSLVLISHSWKDILLTIICTSSVQCLNLNDVNYYFFFSAKKNRMFCRKKAAIINHLLVNRKYDRYLQEVFHFENYWIVQVWRYIKKKK